MHVKSAEMSRKQGGTLVHPTQNNAPAGFLAAYLWWRVWAWQNLHECLLPLRDDSSETLLALSLTSTSICTAQRSSASSISLENS